MTNEINTQNKNILTIKIEGEENNLDSFLNQLEQDYPLHLTSRKVKHFDDNLMHVYVRIAVQGSPAKLTPETANEDNPIRVLHS